MTTTKSTLFFIAGAFCGGSAIILGAFGAHGLESILSPKMLGTYQKAVNYQEIHALLLLFIGLMEQKNPDPWLRSAGWFTLTGIILFSGSLYLLAITGIPALGWITPLGGLSFIIAWFCLIKIKYQQH
jgi:uncharacterized membrane protein YgdD (TMEM256/DUF423 family)